MTLEEIKAYFEANKDNEDVKNYLGGLNPVTPDRVNEFLGTEDGKRLLQPKLDTYHSKGLETWKTNNLDALVTAKVKELHPDTDPKDKALADMNSEIEKMKSEGLRKELTNKALKIAQEKKLPLELVDYLIGADEASTVGNLTSLEQVFSTHIEAVVTERLKGTYAPPGGGGAPGAKNPWSKDQFNLTEQGKIMLENPTLAAQLMAQAK